MCVVILTVTIFFTSVFSVRPLHEIRQEEIKNRKRLGDTASTSNVLDKKRKIAE